MTKPSILLIEPGYIPDSLIERLATSTMPPLGILQVAAMLETARAEAVSATPDPGSTLPALRAQEAVVRDFANERLGRIVSARPAAPAVRDGLNAGRRAAADSDIGRVRLRGRAAIGAGS